MGLFKRVFGVQCGKACCLEIDMDDNPGKKSWKRRILGILGSFVFLCGVCHMPMGPVPIRVSKETTWATEPVLEDGSIDYSVAFDNLHKEGVTLENNALVPLLAIFEIEDPEIRTGLAERLGMTTDDIPGTPHPIVTWEERLEKIPELSEIVDGFGDLSLEDVVGLLYQGEVHPHFEVWARHNEPAMSVAREASHKSHYWLPCVSFEYPSTTFAIVNSWMPVVYLLNISKVLALHAHWKAATGDPRAAWEDVFAVHRLSRLQSTRSTLIEQLVSVVMNASATEAAQGLVANNHFTKGGPRGLLSQLSELRPRIDVMRAINVGERFMMLDSVTALWRGKDISEIADGESFFGAGGMFDPNEMMAGGNEWYDRLIVPLSGPNRAEELRDGRTFPDVDEMLEARRSNAYEIYLYRLGGRPFRKEFSRSFMTLLFALLTPALKKAYWQEIEEVARFELERLAVALAAWKLEKGTFPESLDELKSGLLEEIPPDPLSGSPFVYKRTEEGYLLYSVGCNGVDDKGEKKESWNSEKDDISVRVPWK